MSNERQLATSPGGTGGAARPAPIDGARWRARLAELIAKHKVPAAALGILSGGEIVDVAAGLLSKKTLVEATPDSVFQIGSITKVWTTTLIMQLVDEGKLALDTPVAQIITDFAVSDPQASKQVTIRHLLTHTSGIDGDDFTDTGRGDDCLEQYVARLDQLAQNHPIGATWSYCNSGFVLMGRVIEKLTGGTWDQAMRERLFGPLGLAHTVTLPEEVLLYRAAMGHTAEGTEEPARAAVSGMPRSLGPAGLVSSTPADVLTFARLHLAGGVGRDGERVLSEQSTQAMADKHADLPDKHSLGDSWGLGWIRYGWDGHRLVGHDGNTIGQSAFLRLLPEQGLAVTLLTNGGKARDLYEDLFREIFAEVAGVAMPLPLAPPAELPQVDVTRHVGTYERAGARMEVLDKDGGMLRVTPTGPLAELLSAKVESYDLVPVDSTGDLFAVRAPGAQTWAPVTFYALAGGEQYLHYGARATPKVD